MVVRTRIDDDERQRKNAQRTRSHASQQGPFGDGVYTASLVFWSLVFWSLVFGLWSLVGPAVAACGAEAPMTRDHRKLRVFHDAHALTLAIYKQSRDFPRDEWFGIRSQMRRAAVSVASNLVEGNARPTTPDYLNFLYISLASACELAYLLKLSDELGYAAGGAWSDLCQRSEAVIRQLQGLTQTTEGWVAAEKAQRLADKRKNQRPKTKDQRPKTTQPPSSRR